MSYSGHRGSCKNIVRLKIYVSQQICQSPCLPITATKNCQKSQTKMTYIITITENVEPLQSTHYNETVSLEILSVYRATIIKNISSTTTFAYVGFKAIRFKTRYNQYTPLATQTRRMIPHYPNICGQ